MINESELLNSLSRFAVGIGKPAPTLEDVRSSIAKIDELEVLNSWKDRIEVETWNGVSNVNSATPEYIRDNNPWADVVYIVKVDGKPTYLQTHDPFESGHVPVTSDTISLISGTHAEQIAENATLSQIFQYVIDDLGIS
jgi:hypothetical protein